MADFVDGIDLAAGTNVTIAKTVTAGTRGALARYEIAASGGGGALVLVSDTTLGASAASIDIASISGSYKALRVFAYLRGDTAALTTNILLRLNNDSGSTYDRQIMYGFATTAGANQAYAATSVNVGDAAAATAAANQFAFLDILIPNYANSSNNKTGEFFSGVKHTNSTGSASMLFGSLFWRSNAAITRATLLPGAGNWVAGSRVTIYGMN